MQPIYSVLFDLDGTLLDTAPDILLALNYLRQLHHLPVLSPAAVRSTAGTGMSALLKLAFNIDAQHHDYTLLSNQFYNFYQTHLADSTRLFPAMEQVLTYLDQHQIPWGIVTNKLTHSTMRLLQALHLADRPKCIVCGDTLAKCKPEPDQILYACQQLNHSPQHVLYIGDTLIDVLASKAAGSPSLVALYGYAAADDNPYAWQADGYISTPQEIIDWLV